MAISLDKALGLHANGLVLRAKRAEIIAGNIANADTPGYKAKGMDFQKSLAQASQRSQQGMSRTHDKHFDVRMEVNNGLGYRIPNQTDTGDGNTVDVQVERNLYMKNTLEYQTSFSFLNGTIKGLKKAISGGQ